MKTQTRQWPPECNLVQETVSTKLLHNQHGPLPLPSYNGKRGLLPPTIIIAAPVFFDAAQLWKVQDDSLIIQTKYLRQSRS